MARYAVVMDIPSKQKGANKKQNRSTIKYFKTGFIQNEVREK